MEKIVLLGCGGHAKSVVDIIEANGAYEIIGFIGTDADRAFEYRGYRNVGSDDDLAALHRAGIGSAFVCVGFLGEGRCRNRLYECALDVGYRMPAVIDPSAIIATDAVIGDGTFIGKNAVINAAASVGKMAIINSAAVIEHDCAVGDFSHISVGAVLCGTVAVGENTFIGAGSTVIQGKTIGDRVIVGAGSLVLSDVPDDKKVWGLVKKQAL